MSFTKDRVFSDLRESGSTPSASNSSYEFDVQNWCFFHLGYGWDIGELGFRHLKPYCSCFDDWVQDFAFKFKEYAKQHWKGSYKSFKSAHKAWLATPVEFPKLEEDQCLCVEDNQVFFS